MHSKLLILLVLGILTIPATGLTAPGAGPAQAEAAAVKTLISEHRQQLVNLRDALAKATEPGARAALEEKIGTAKSSLELRIVRTRLDFALKAGDSERADRMLGIIQQLEQPRVPYASVTKDSTALEVTE